MNSIRIALVIAVSLTLGLSNFARAGAPGSGNRIEDLEALCEGGTSNGLPCFADDDCHGGLCQVVTDGTLKKPIPMTVTLVVDDDTGEWNRDEEEDDIHTVSVLLEFIVDGRRRFLAQNYMNVKGEDAAALIKNMKQGVEIADLPDSDRRLDEALAVAAKKDKGIFDDFLFQRADGEMEKKLRHYFDTTGNFVVTETRWIRGFSNQRFNSLATVIQARLSVDITPAN